MKKIIIIILLALSVASCQKEEGANPSQDCWKVVRYERGINFVGGGSSPSYITIFKDGIYRKVNTALLAPKSEGYNVGDWYCY